MIRIVFFSTLLCLFAAAPARAQTESEAGPVSMESQAAIAVTVNGDAVTKGDINDRMRLIMASSGMPDNDDVRRKVGPQVTNMLIEESLIMQEAARNNITVKEEDVKQGFAALAGQNKFTPEQFHEVLAHSRINESALNNQIKSQIAWTKIIVKKIRPQIEISDNQVDAELKKLKASVGAQEYQVAEIYLPVDQPQQEAEVKQLAERLSAQMAGGKVRFSSIASQFSQSASASRGGDMGWIRSSQLSPQVEDVVTRMTPGELSKPVRSLTGYTIVLLRDKRAITAETMPTRDDIRQQIGMSTLDRMQRRYMLDLKSSAFIDKRA